MHTSAHGLSRRQFLRTTAAASCTAPFLLESPLHAAAPNSKLNHACIGVGGMGWGDLQNFLQHPRVQVVALCDVDADFLKKAAELVPGARTYRDWRELLEREGDRVDSVNVTVPDHMHFPIAFEAIRRRKHVYCQKPMCHDVAEVRALTEAAARQRVVTQLGTQMASMAGDRTTVQWLRAGVIGKVQHLYLSANRPGAVEMYRPLGPRPAERHTPPDRLAWDLWLGTAPERPFVPDLYHPVKWRGWLDFGTGWSGDIGCHIFDAVWKGLDLSAPTSVIARAQASWAASPARRADTWPQANHITWTFPGNALTAGPELPVEWYDGDFWAPEEVRARFSVSDYPTESAMVIGTEGALLNPLGATPLLLPEDRFKDIPRPRFDNRNHYHHFAEACLGGAPCESQFAQTGPMTEAILLGTVAVQTPTQRLEWDPAALRIPNHPTADRLLRRTYRAGWEVRPI
ncbi:MAG: Gfo/Idh/MocA family oxidoreductase [Verrucomicrobia bacterium]|nr:Gfo/Idh/MocA family oxidoreductase [Verrucomicrobiota bacterium]